MALVAAPPVVAPKRRPVESGGTLALQGYTPLGDIGLPDNDPGLKAYSEIVDQLGPMLADQEQEDSARVRQAIRLVAGGMGFEQARLSSHLGRVEDRCRPAQDLLFRGLNAVYAPEKWGNCQRRVEIHGVGETSS